MYFYHIIDIIHYIIYVIIHIYIIRVYTLFNLSLCTGIIRDRAVKASGIEYNLLLNYIHYIIIIIIMK